MTTDSTRAPGRRLLVVLAALPLLILPSATASAGPVAAASVDVAGGSDPVGGWPLLPTHRVVHGFDPPDHVGAPGHRGVDLLGRAGEPVLAGLGGTVTFAGGLAGRGVVVIAHGADRTTYEPVAATVRVGAAVATGARIGTLEVTQSHCFPRACLHWGWLRGSAYRDPLRLVGAAKKIRLLPLSRPLSGSVRQGCLTVPRYVRMS